MIIINLYLLPRTVGGGGRRGDRHTEGKNNRKPLLFFILLLKRMTKGGKRLNNKTLTTQHQSRGDRTSQRKLAQDFPSGPSLTVGNTAPRSKPESVVRLAPGPLRRPRPAAQACIPGPRPLQQRSALSGALTPAPGTVTAQHTGQSVGAHPPGGLPGPALKSSATLSMSHLLMIQASHLPCV